MALAAECTPTVGPSIPPPTTVPSGIPGFHAYWYGQSGYPTLCPGETSVATVAFYNSGSAGWAYYTAQAALGTSGPQPGQDQPSILGGNSNMGTPHTRWSDFNRPAIQPAPWIGPNQVAWFQFTVKAPPTPGTYRLYLRPLIDGLQWLEDFGVFWQVTVIPTSSTPERVTVATVNKEADLFTAGGAPFLYDRNDSFELGDGTITLDEFEQIVSPGVVVETRYEPSAPQRSHFNIVDAPGYNPPTVSPRVGSFDRGSTNNDVRVDLIPPASGADQYGYIVQRAVVAAGTATCIAISGRYQYIEQYVTGAVDLNLPSGTYCYRAAVAQSFFGYSAPVTIPVPPATATPNLAPRSVDARARSSPGGSAKVFDFGDRLEAVFDMPVRVCDADAAIRFRDADGTLAELSMSTRNIGCARNDAPENVGGTTYPAFTVLTITIVAPPIVIEPGATPGLQLPAVVQTATGIREDGGLAWDVPSSADFVFGEPD